MTPEKRQALDREQRRADLLAVMRTPEGRRLIWGLIHVDCNAMGVGYVIPSHDPHGRQHAYNDGRRSIGCELDMESLHAAPEEHEQMVRTMEIEAGNRVRERGLNAPVPNPGDR